jgi:hypothetical protein
MVNNWCFGTLAVGKRYREHAINLAKDIQLYAPKISLIVLTDKPEEFIEYPVVQAIEHRLLKSLLRIYGLSTFRLDDL